VAPIVLRKMRQEISEKCIIIGSTVTERSAWEGYWNLKLSLTFSSFSLHICLRLFIKDTTYFVEAKQLKDLVKALV
jgi:hypothetical protein